MPNRKIPEVPPVDWGPDFPPEKSEVYKRAEALATQELTNSGRAATPGSIVVQTLIVLQRMRLNANVEAQNTDDSIIESDNS